VEEDEAHPDIGLPYFFSAPAGAAPWPGLVILHEGGGISAQLLRCCERLARHGYGTVAPDLFFRVGVRGRATSEP